jgi:hypothetical protein
VVRPTGTVRPSPRLTSRAPIPYCRSVYDAWAAILNVIPGLSTKALEIIERAFGLLQGSVSPTELTHSADVDNIPESFNPYSALHLHDGAWRGLLRHILHSAITVASAIARAPAGQQDLHTLLGHLVESYKTLIGLPQRKEYASGVLPCFQEVLRVTTSFTLSGFYQNFPTCSRLAGPCCIVEQAASCPRHPVHSTTRWRPYSPLTAR